MIVVCRLKAHVKMEFNLNFKTFISEKYMQETGKHTPPMKSTIPVSMLGELELSESLERRWNHISTQ